MGVILFHDVGRRTNRRTPHTHGGDSSRRSRREVDDWYSPYTWGWFYSLNDAIRQGYVLPIHMGVILFRWSYPSVLQSTPHTHGGDSELHTTKHTKEQVLPIHMGVILARRGWHRPCRSTPHTHGGDSQNDSIAHQGGKVLPIHMGVIPCMIRVRIARKCTPHTHGGDSYTD